MSSSNLLYDTFNAKYLTYQEVASSFILNDEFAQLITNNHTLLMGPRGCGKTTLLKMLTPIALHYWKSPYAEEIKKQIPFIAVYIPTDIQWKSQLAYLAKNLSEHPELNEKISDFLIATNIQVALCRTFHSLIDLKPTNSKEKIALEEEVCTQLIHVWGIENSLSAGFDDLEIALDKRVESVNKYVSRVIYQKQKEILFDHLPDYFYADFFKLLSNGCKAFDKVFKENDKHRWALCFDELEIAPKYLQIKLYSFLRSTSQEFLFKLTTTPLVNIEENLIEAAQDNDYKPIRLWVFDDQSQKKWETFCDELISKKIQRHLNNSSILPKDVFSEYNLNDLIISELGLKITPSNNDDDGKLENILFNRLAEKDESFRKFLHGRLKSAKSNTANDYKSIFLKYKVKVLYRYIYKDRTRKLPAINYGIPYLYDICDGNPRSIIGLVDELLLNISKDDKEFLSENKQSNIVVEASRKYFNLIKNHPDSTLTIRNKQFNLATDLLGKVGYYIHERIVKAEFDKSVPTTFIVDPEIDNKILTLLEHALHLGAIVYLDPLESLSRNGLIKKRFRISYLLTPLFRIPNRVDGKINLQTILNNEEGEANGAQTSIFNINK